MSTSLRRLQGVRHRNASCRRGEPGTRRPHNSRGPACCSHFITFSMVPDFDEVPSISCDVLCCSHVWRCKSSSVAASVYNQPLPPPKPPAHRALLSESTPQARITHSLASILSVYTTNQADKLPRSLHILHIHAMRLPFVCVAFVATYIALSTMAVASTHVVSPSDHHSMVKKLTVSRMASALSARQSSLDRPLPSARRLRPPRGRGRVTRKETKNERRLKNRTVLSRYENGRRIPVHHECRLPLGSRMPRQEVQA